MKYVVFTMDIDWATEAVIQNSLNYFLDAKVPVSTFLTHKSEVLSKNSDNVQFGMHPNFFPGSTHGSKIDEVIDTCKDFSPGLNTSRSHGLMFSSNIMLAMASKGIENDMSIINPFAEPIVPIRFHLNGNLFKRYSFNWEDDLFFFYEDTERYYQLRNYNLEIMVVNFHPIHIFLNSLNLDHYTDYKNGNCKAYTGTGTETFLKELLLSVKQGKLKAISLNEYFKIMDSKA